MTYRVDVEARAARQIRRLPRGIQERVTLAAYALGSDPRPHGYDKLAGRDNEYRIRVGDYRIVYAIHDDVLVVMVIEVGPRDQIYRRR